jgi:quinol monooxygenase YgiN
MWVSLARGRLAPADREAFAESARRSVAAANEVPGCVLYRQMVDLLDPDMVYVLECWESEEAFERHAGSPSHITRIEELLGMDFSPQESYRFDVASWRKGAGADLRAALERARSAAAGAGATPES